MLNFIKLKLEQASENPPGGGTSTPPAQAAPVAAATPELDEFGYEKVTPAGDPAAPPEAGDKSKPNSKDQKVGDQKVSSGYGDEPPKVDPPAKPVEPPPAEEPIDLGYEVKVDEVVPKEVAHAAKKFAKDHFSKEKIDAIATKHNLSAEAVADVLKMQQDGIQAYLNTIATNTKAYTDAQKVAEAEAARTKQETRASWHKELKEDAHFGGEKFGYNVKLVDRVFKEYGQEWDKVLTEKDVVLPPYVMRMMAKVGERLFETDKLQQGAPVVPPPPKQENDPLDFYNQ